MAGCCAMLCCTHYMCTNKVCFVRWFPLHIVGQFGNLANFDAKALHIKQFSFAIGIITYFRVFTFLYNYVNVWTPAHPPIPFFAKQHADADADAQQKPDVASKNLKKKRLFCRNGWETTVSPRLPACLLSRHACIRQTMAPLCNQRKPNRICIHGFPFHLSRLFCARRT